MDVKKIEDYIIFTLPNPCYKDIVKECGTHNGYVTVPKSSLLYGVKYNELGDLGLQTGILSEITWAAKSGKLEEEPYQENDRWTVGFDTAHHGDTAEEWNEKTVFDKAIELYKLIKYLEESTLLKIYMKRGEIAKEETFLMDYKECKFCGPIDRRLLHFFDDFYNELDPD